MTEYDLDDFECFSDSDSDQFSVKEEIPVDADFDTLTANLCRDLQMCRWVLKDAPHWTLAKEAQIVSDCANQLKLPMFDTNAFAKEVHTPVRCEQWRTEMLMIACGKTATSVGALGQYRPPWSGNLPRRQPIVWSDRDCNWVRKALRVLRTGREVQLNLDEVDAIYNAGQLSARGALVCAAWACQLIGITDVKRPARGAAIMMSDGTVKSLDAVTTVCKVLVAAASSLFETFDSVAAIKVNGKRFDRLSFAS